MAVSSTRGLALMVGAALWVPIQAHALGELTELYRDPGAQAMGNALTAIVDDDASLFYNPAGLAGVNSTAIKILAADTEASGAFYSVYQRGLSTFNHINPDTLNGFIGQDLYARSTVTTSYASKNFGLAVFSDQQLAVYEKNQALPQSMLGYQTTSGIQFGYGIKIDRFSRGKNELRVGVAGKLVFRRGGYPVLPLAQLLNISEDGFKQMIGSFGHAYGGDLGIQYIRKLNSRLSLLGGVDYANIGGLNFGGPLGYQPENLSVGVGVRYQHSNFRVMLAYDCRHITQSTDWRMRNHAGVQVGLPALRLYGGVNQVYPAFGFAFDIWLASVTALEYEEELGSMVHQDPERRYELRIAFGLGI